MRHGFRASRAFSATDRDNNLTHMSIIGANSKLHESRAIISHNRHKLIFIRNMVNIRRLLASSRAIHRPFAKIIRCRHTSNASSTRNIWNFRILSTFKSLCVIRYRKNLRWDIFAPSFRSYEEQYSSLMIGKIISLMPSLLRDQQTISSLHFNILTIIAFLHHGTLENVIHFITRVNVDWFERGTWGKFIDPKQHCISRDNKIIIIACKSVIRWINVMQIISFTN